VDLHVYYAHRATPKDQADAGFSIRFDWDVALLEGYSFSWLPNRARHAGVHGFFGCDTPSVGAELTRQHFDAVLVNGWNLLCFWQAVRGAKSCGLPVMVRGDSQLPTPRGFFRRTVKKLAYPHLLNRFDAFLSVGTRNSEYLRSYGVSSDRIFSAPHCVDNDFFRSSADSARSDFIKLQDRFAIPGGGTTFLFVGKFLPRKRPLDFLGALDRLKHAGHRVWGLLVGSGPLEKEMREHAAQHNTPCSFAGFLNQQQIGAAYALADVLVLPSNTEETWGLVVNEAMACGVPAIVSDGVGCAPDLITEGKTGFMYPDGNLEELTDRMESLVQDRTLRFEMSRRVQIHIERFSLDAACEGMLCALDSLLGSKEPAC
jgi:glycosyltransferase involved in cell wall biosynthesis